MIYDLLKLTFIPGLKNIVEDEIAQYPTLEIAIRGKEEIYLKPIEDLKNVLCLKSILNVYVIKRGQEFNPYFISKHKSILGNLIESVLHENKKAFRTFKVSCAGSQSKEVLQIQKYVADTFKLSVAEDADVEIYIGKSDRLWEIGVRLTSRPLSLRDYKVENIKGGLNPTIGFAMNTFCNLDKINSYLNIFSGSATLLIEAAIINPNIKYVGFDSDGKTNALAIKNIKKAGLLRSINLKTANIFDTPVLGKFDAITSDLPFGMQISKGEDLEKLYECFVDSCGDALVPDGILVAYTSEHKILETIINNSKFKIIETVVLKLPTSVQAYLYPKIFVCTLSN